MQPDRGHRQPSSREALTQSLTIGGRQVPVEFVRNPRARKYILRMREDGTVRVTIPRSGSLKVAWIFAREKTDWLESQLHRPKVRGLIPVEWPLGEVLMFRGEKMELVAASAGEKPAVSLGGEVFEVPRLEGDLRPWLEPQLRQMAVNLLVPRTFELARRTGSEVRRVSIRAQRTRWGSCSSKANISLNWRLLLTPEFVVDYLIIHELMHLREMNHSARYWDLVEKACPDYLRAEQWLKRHETLLR